MLNVYKISQNNQIYGPGKRTVIWFRGCSIHCKECINPELWNRHLESDIPIDELIAKISNDSVTLLGGEPLDQEDLELFIDSLIAQNKGIILFTGYSIKDYDERKKRITSKCDVVISEPFIRDLKDDSLYLRGSSNQIITFNTNRYSKNDFNKPNIMSLNIKDNSVESFGRNKNLIKELLDL